MMLTEYNAKTGITTEREMTAEEIAQVEAMQNEVQPEPQPEPQPQQTLEEKVTELQNVISELTTILNDKGIAP